MYSAQDIQTRLRKKPFQPLRIIVSEGLRYDIHHPDLVLVGMRDLTIGFPAKENPGVYDQMTRVALVHVVALEDLPVSQSTDNGQQE